MDSVVRALELKKELDSLRPIKPEDERRIMDKFRLDWNYHSNNLEGNSLTYGETKALILFGITAQGKPLKDHFEITGHNEAILLVMDVVKEERPLTENFIRELHKLLLKEPYEVDAITPDGKPTKKLVAVGAYKAQPNHVETKTGEIFRFATPEETPAMMFDLMEWLQQQKADSGVNPILLGAEFHYKFIRIHPFDDGNGRVARILMNFILMQYGFPPVIIRTEDKENYFAALRQADAGMIKPFVEYIGSNLVRSMELMIKGAKGENIEEDDDLEKQIRLLYQTARSYGSVKTAKSKDALLSFYDGPLQGLIKRFIDANESLKKFYLADQVLISVNGVATVDTIAIQLAHCRTKMDMDVETITLQQMFKQFNISGFKEFSYTSTILIKFKLGEVQLSNKNESTTIQKNYGEAISNREFDDLINSEKRLHKEFIEKRMKEGGAV